MERRPERREKWIEEKSIEAGSRVEVKRETHILWKGRQSRRGEKKRVVERSVGMERLRVHEKNREAGSLVEVKRETHNLWEGRRGELAGRAKII